MAYKISTDGTVDLGEQKIPVPATVSAEARAYLASPPWLDEPPVAGPTAMWEARASVDEMLAQLNKYARKLYPVEIDDIEIQGVSCHLVKPIDPRHTGDRRPVLINMHGGGFVMGSGSLIEAIPIAHLTGIPVISIDYRLAPEHPYPAAIDDILAVYRGVLERHAPGDIGIYGSSAGRARSAIGGQWLECERLAMRRQISLHEKGCCRQIEHPG